VAAAAREHGLVIHTHLAESPTEAREVAAAVGDTAARYFAKHDVLGPRFVGAHGVWLEDDELAALGKADAALVHCPGSNLKLGSGFANLRRWRTAGIRSGLGSDGAACNNRLDTFQEMNLAAGLTRVLEPAQPLTSRDVLALATCDGARALGLGGRVGSLEAGKQADVAVVDARGPHAAPSGERDPYTTLVHACGPRDVRLTMVAGRVLYRDGAWSTLDPERAIADARAEAQGLLRRMEAA
jgi:5-methylthioadenosine/S-adenosylhomocysteine deaminase